MIGSSFHLLYTLSFGIGLTLLRVPDTVAEEETDAPNKIESGLFTTISGCEQGYLSRNSYVKATVRSRTGCALRCLSDPTCLSINLAVGRVGGDACILYDAATHSCSDLTKSTHWTYLRLTNYKGDRRTSLESAGTVPLKCNYQGSCYDQKCANWEMVYEIIENTEVYGDKQCLMQAISRGASVRVALKLTDGFYHRLTPITYFIGPSEDNTNTVYFHFMPRYYTLYDKSYKQSRTFKDYIGMSVAGKYTVRTYSIENIKMRESVQDKLSAMFFIQNISCALGGTPAYTVSSGDAETNNDIQELTYPLSRGAYFIVNLKNGNQITSVLDRWSRYDVKTQGFVIIKYQGESFLDASRLTVKDPLRRHYTVVASHGLVMESEENAMTSEVLSSLEFKDDQVWYADLCWQLAFMVFSNGSEHRVYNSDYLMIMLKQGRAVRLQTFDNDVVTTSSIQLTKCSGQTCMAFSDGHPAMKASEGLFEFNWNETSYNEPILTQSAGRLIISYSTMSSTFKSSNVPEVSWFVDSMFHEIVFVATKKEVVRNHASDFSLTGANLRMVIICNENSFDNAQIEEVIQHNDNIEFHTPIFIVYAPASAANCQNSEVTRSKLILQTNPFTLKETVWTADWRFHCAIDHDIDFEEVTIFADYIEALTDVGNTKGKSD